MLLGLIFGLQLLFLIATSFKNLGAAFKKDAQRNYIIVIDAGSTGSRIHVYPYIPAKPLPIFFPDEEFTEKRKPGLSSFQNNPSKAGNSLGAILDEAKKNIPASTPLKKVPIFLVATAGLRRVRTMDPQASAQIMSSVRSTLKLSGFRFKDSWAQIIEGAQEGSFGWVTANYLLGNFENPNAETTGVFEMGGESVQLTFLPTTPLPRGLSNRLITPVHIAGHTYNLIAQSWMGYGMEAAQAKFDNLIADEELSPCYLTGDVRQSSGQDPDITWKGEGNYFACYLLLKEILRTSKGDCMEQDELLCSLDGLLIPYEMGEILLIENFWYTANVAGFNDEQMKGPTYYSRMQEFGKEYCETTLDNARTFLQGLTDYSSDEDELQSQCFSAAYVNAMVKEGLGIATSDSYQAVRNIDNADLDWALGYAIVQEAAGTLRSGGKRNWFLVYLAVLLVFAVVVFYVIWKRTSRVFPRYGQLTQKDPKESSWSSIRKTKAHQSPVPKDDLEGDNNDPAAVEDS